MEGHILRLKKFSPQNTQYGNYSAKLAIAETNEIINCFNNLVNKFDGQSIMEAISSDIRDGIDASNELLKHLEGFSIKENIVRMLVEQIEISWERVKYKVIG